MRTLISLLATSCLLSLTLQAVVEKPTTKAEYEQVVTQAQNNGNTVAVKYFLPSCPMCKEIKGLFNELDKEVSNVVFVEVDASNKEFAGLKKANAPKGFPTTVVYAANGTKTVIVGADPGKIKTAVAKASKTTATKAAPVKAKAAAPAPQVTAPAVKTERVAGVQHPTTKAAYDILVQQAKDSGNNVAIKYTTSWCTYCKDIAGIFDELDKEGNNFVFIELDGDNKEFAAIKKEHKVTGYPTTIIVDKSGKKTVIAGAQGENIKNTVRKLSRGGAAPAQPIPVKEMPAKKEPVSQKNTKQMAPKNGTKSSGKKMKAL